MKDDKWREKIENEIRFLEITKEREMFRRILGLSPLAVQAAWQSFERLLGKEFSNEWKTNDNLAKLVVVLKNLAELRQGGSLEDFITEEEAKGFLEEFDFL